MENENVRKNKLNEITKIFFIFMIGSVIGYVVEMIVAFVQEGHFESRQGVLYGPFTPVYGIGILVFYMFFNRIKTREKKKIFLLAMLLGGITEYLCSFLQEKIFGTISWDYSNWILNINGRTTLIHCTYWGIAGILYISYIEPILPKLEALTRKNGTKILAGGMAILMFFNITISSLAAIRQKYRNENIEPQNKLEEFLDEKYPDEYMDKVFANKKQVS
mgnify:FL=1